MKILNKTPTNSSKIFWDVQVQFDCHSDKKEVMHCLWSVDKLQYEEKKIELMQQFPGLTESKLDELGQCQYNIGRDDERDSNDD